jgi:hypothetical protein
MHGNSKINGNEGPSAFPEPSLIKKPKVKDYQGVQS